ncbi:MAG: hypothetical protein ACRCXT_23745 [Paraclostridium sp.]
MSRSTKQLEQKPIDRYNHYIDVIRYVVVKATTGAIGVNNIVFNNEILDSLPVRSQRVFVQHQQEFEQNKNTLTKFSKNLYLPYNKR